MPSAPSDKHGIVTTLASRLGTQAPPALFVAGREPRNDLDLPAWERALFARQCAAIVRKPADPALRRRGLSWLRDLGESAAPSVDALIIALDQSASVNDATRVAATLGAIGRAASPAVPRLISMLDDPRSDEPVSFTTAFIDSLGAIGDPRALPALAAVLDERKPQWEHLHQRVAAIRAIAAIGPSTSPAADALRRALLDDDAAVRDAAALALSAIKPDDSR